MVLPQHSPHRGIAGDPAQQLILFLRDHSEISPVDATGICSIIFLGRLFVNASFEDGDERGITLWRTDDLIIVLRSLPAEAAVSARAWRSDWPKQVLPLSSLRGRATAAGRNGR